MTQTRRPLPTWDVRAAVLIAVSVLSQVAGAALFKVGAERAVALEQPQWWAIVWTWLNPFFVAGLACLVVQTLAWMLVLRRVPLSRAYPFMACVLPLNFLVAMVWFSEVMRWNHGLGMAVICVGLVLVARGDEEAV